MDTKQVQCFEKRILKEVSEKDKNEDRHLCLKTETMCVCVCVCACVRACARVCVHVCVQTNSTAIDLCHQGIAVDMTAKTGSVSNIDTTSQVKAVPHA